MFIELRGMTEDLNAAEFLNFQKVEDQILVICKKKIPSSTILALWQLTSKEV